LSKVTLTCEEHIPKVSNFFKQKLELSYKYFQMPKMAKYKNKSHKYTDLYEKITPKMVLSDVLVLSECEWIAEKIKFLDFKGIRHFNL
jgi:hypothetical protein